MIKFITAVLLGLFAAAAFAAVDVNKASQAELESIKGIGTTMSTRILDARKSGPFADWADLRGRVKGVGDSKAGKFSADGLTVNGTSYSNASAGPTSAKFVKPKAKKGEKNAEKAKS